MKISSSFLDYVFDGGCNGRDAALRRPRPAGRNERGKPSVLSSPGAALGDGTAQRAVPTSNFRHLHNPTNPAKLKTKILIALWLVGTILLLAWLLYQPGETGDDLRTPIYDETADASKQIADALVVAKKDNKRVLLQFGANWCYWCHVLHHLFDTNKAVHGKIQSDYVVVLVDVNNGHNGSTVEKYGQPTQFGLPVIVVLDSGGKQLVTQSVLGFGENGEYSPQKILDFLNKWTAH